MGKYVISICVYVSVYVCMCVCMCVCVCVCVCERARVYEAAGPADADGARAVERSLRCVAIERGLLV